jgi:hypothetical protein
MRYFEKIAVGPQTLTMQDFMKSYSNEMGEIPSGAQGFYVPPKDLQGKKLDTKYFPKDLKKRQRMLREGLLVTQDTGFKGMDRFVKRHELTHYMRAKKGKGSIKKYNTSAVSRLVEETAASAASLKKIKGFKSVRYPLGVLQSVAQETHLYPKSTALKFGLPAAAGLAAYKIWKNKNK